MAVTATADRILDTAEELIQTRGLNAMSYADIATRLGIRKASLHYHFASKADLVEALIQRYSQRFFAALDRIETSNEDAVERLREYADIYRTVLERGRMCLCGMLASDYQTLTPASQRAVAAYFDGNRDWLERIIAEGVQAGRLAPQTSARVTAQALIAGLEGAMLILRASGGAGGLTDISGSLIGALEPATAR